MKTFCVVLVYNDRKELQKCIESLKQDCHSKVRMKPSLSSSS